MHDIAIVHLGELSIARDGKSITKKDDAIAQLSDQQDYKKLNKLV